MTVSTMRDPYQILGVGRQADSEEIKLAFRKLAKQYHPDLHPGRADIETKFKEISAAYDLLSDPDKRGRYDRGEIDGHGADRHDRGGFHRSGGGGGGGGREGFEDIFAQFFRDRRRGGGTGGMGGTAGGAKPHRGSDINYAVTVTFIEAATGARRRISLSNGKSIDITIPPGTEDQQKLRLKGQGMNGANGGVAGDAIVEVHVETHPFFTRVDSDIHVEVPISLPEAVLGATIKVPTVDGQVALKIPAGTNTGSVLRLKGKGVFNQKSQLTGDQYVKLKVMLPDPPDTELVQFMEKWSRERSYDVRKKMFSS